MISKLIHTGVTETKNLLLSLSNRRAEPGLGPSVARGLGLDGPGQQSHAAVSGGSQEEPQDLITLLRLRTNSHRPALSEAVCREIRSHIKALSHWTRDGFVF